jgi:hypothetical protein
MRAAALAVVLAAFTVGLATGCGQSAPKEPPTRLPSYLAFYPQEQPRAVYFLQWEQSGMSVDGTLSIAYPNSDGEVTTRTQPVEGKIDGDTVKLEVGTDPAQEWAGTRSGRKIVFEADLGDDTKQTLIFVPARLAAFKQAVAGLR